jgi:ribosomal peptide maturation radical SAM protein 1
MTASQEQKTGTRPPKLLLVHMPWAATRMAPIQTGLLKSVAQQAGFEADDICPNLDLLKFISPQTYTLIEVGVVPVMVGEWLFAKHIQSPNCDDKSLLSDSEYLDFLLSADRISPEQKIILEETRAKAIPAYLQYLMEHYAWGDYDLIGFTCVFSQAAPSLALARCIKKKFPNTRIVFGGAQCENPMGEAYLQAFDWIDYIVHGPGEGPIVELLQSIAENRTPEISGLIDRANGEIRTTPRAREMPLDKLPTPNYDTYFTRADELGIDGQIAMEASRGCWWGEKHHCTFCGIAPETMPFRAKSAGKVFAEMQALSSRYGVLDFVFTDYIMDYKYFDAFLPLLEESCQGQHCFFETKVNISRQQLESMGRSGIRTIQPGIESFSTPVLKLMDKGSSAIQCVQLLRWCAELDIRPSYNILFGFPGELAEHYRSQLELLPLLEHLEPPEMVGPIVVHRYSPLFKQTAPQNLRGIRARDDYNFLFDKSVVDIPAIAYEHQSEPLANIKELMPYHERLSQLTVLWREADQKGTSRLEYRAGPDFLRIEDTRNNKNAAHLLEGPAKEIYLYFWKAARSTEKLQKDFKNKGQELDPAYLEDLLTGLKELGLIYEEDGRFLSLAIPHRVHRIAQIKEPRFGASLS